MARYDIAESELDARGMRVGIVAARFNGEVVARLLAGAEAALARHRVDPASVTLVRVPGAFEIPLAAQRLATLGGVDALITLGAVVRGETPHFDYVAGECARGVARVALDAGLPVIFGVLTADTMAQALARAGGEHGNKGEEAALAALEMASLLRRLAARAPAR